jgi:hypothetical protein
MPDIMLTPRARTISEQSEEYDKVSRVSGHGVSVNNLGICCKKLAF